jgi:hypothetical protein
MVSWWLFVPWKPQQRCIWTPEMLRLVSSVSLGLVSENMYRNTFLPSLNSIQYNKRLKIFTWEHERPFLYEIWWKNTSNVKSIQCRRLLNIFSHPILTAQLFPKMLSRITRRWFSGWSSKVKGGQAHSKHAVASIVYTNDFWQGVDKSRECFFSCRPGLVDSKRLGD